VEHNLTVWYGTTTEKILSWRQLRQQLADKNLEEIINEVNNWWTYSPWVKSTINPYKPDSWPTPWELLDRGEFCRSAIALGQAYTLKLILEPSILTELWLINNFSEKEIHLVPVIDQKWMLNYTLGQVFTTDKCQFEVLSKTSVNELTHIKI
jgi:hypothetical protein